jgi:hypothetical protein
LLGFSARKSVRKNAFDLMVWAHQQRVHEFETFASEKVMNHPRLKIEHLPPELEDGKYREPRSRTLALARIRQQWEAEIREVVATN